MVRVDVHRKPVNETRAPLSRERVLQAALGLADQGGIEALSMRKLGQALGVEAMSLYNHVAKKDDVLAGILELVVQEIDVPAARPTGRRRSAAPRSRRTKRCCDTVGRAA